MALIPTVKNVLLINFFFYFNYEALLSVQNHYAP